MKYLKPYKSHFVQYNESITHLLKPKSEEDILKKLEKLSDSDRIKVIIKNKLPYNFLPDNLIIDGNLWCNGNELTKLPDNLNVKGDLYCISNRLTKLPDNLIVKGNLNCRHNQLIELNDNLIVKGNLYCDYNQLIELPNNLIVKGSLYCSNNQLSKDTKKPKGVKGEMFL